MRIGQRYFKPRLIPSIVTFLLLPILISLGFWQLDRAEQKRTILRNVETRMQQQAFSSIPVAQGIDRHQLDYRRVSLRGRFDLQHTLYLDNKVYQGKVGYFVFSPFLVANSRRNILVNRGWIKMGSDRAHLPSVNTPNKDIVINGILRDTRHSVISLTNQSFDKVSWPLVVQWISHSQLKSVLTYAVSPFIVLQDKSDSGGFIREWKFIPAKPQQSTSYAVQWFSLAVVLLVIYVGVNLRREDHTEQSRRI